MKSPHQTYLNWSTGKDSALALYHLQQLEPYHISHLLTSVNEEHNRVSMHGLRRSLLDKQVAALDIPCSTVELPAQPDMVVYESRMNTAVLKMAALGCSHAAFGDIFLEDLKRYREQQLAPFGIKTVFPLWQQNTKALLQNFISLGFKAILICVDASKLDASFAGRIIDEDFINDLPDGVDPCGENGEYHTFCFDGPIFRDPVPFKVGEKVYREYDAPAGQGSGAKAGFWFCDLSDI